MVRRVWSASGSLFLVVLLAAALAGPAYAVSKITNRLSISPVEFGCGRTVTIKVETDFEWLVIPNPYWSDFRAAVQARHFRKPNNYFVQARQNTAWYYVASDGVLSNQPSWRYDGGEFVVVGDEFQKVHATATTASNFSSPKMFVGSRWNWHGQEAWLSSSGTPVWVLTTHTGNNCT